MNPDNIKSGLQAHALSILMSSSSASDTAKEKGSPEPDLAAVNGLAYIPLFSPAPSRQKRAVNFTEEEEELFQRRYENGYDLKHDEHYNEWISLNHPSISDSSTVEVADDTCSNCG